MYLRHVFVKTGKLYWTMVQHTWGDDESVVRPKCELVLMYLGHGWYGEYILLVNPEQDMLTLENLSTNKPPCNKKTPTKKPKHDKPIKTPSSNQSITMES